MKKSALVSSRPTSSCGNLTAAPPRDETPPPTNSGWTTAFADLDEGRVDTTLLPFAPVAGLAEAAAQFVARPLYEEGHSVAMRRGHPLANGLTLDQYFAADHVIASKAGMTDAGLVWPLDTIERVHRAVV